MYTMLDSRLNLAFLSTIVIFFLFSMWFVNEYVGFLKTEPKQERSSVLPNLIEAVNKNDMKILDKVHRNKKRIEDMDKTLKNKLNQIETNKRNVTQLYTDIKNVQKRVNEDNLKTLSVLEDTLAENNKAIIQESVANLDEQWSVKNKEEMDALNSDALTNLRGIQEDIYADVYDNMSTDFVSQSNFVDLSSNVDSMSNNLNRIDGLAKSNQETIGSLSSMYASQSDFTTLSNNVDSMSNNLNRIDAQATSNQEIIGSLSSMYASQSDFVDLSSNVDSMSNNLSRIDGLAESNQETIGSLSNYLTSNNFLTESTIDSTMSNYLTSNNFLTESTIDSTMSNYLTSNNFLTESTIDSTMSNYLSDNNYLNSNNISSNFVSQSELESFSNSLSSMYVSQSDFTTLSNNTINDVGFSNNQIIFQRYSGSNITIELPTQTTADIVIQDEPTSLSLSLDSNNLCVQLNGESNCIPMSNLQQHLYTKTQYPTD